MDVIPAHLGREIPNSGMFNNVMLRIGEVQEIVYPDDPRSVSKRFTEYRVWVQHRSNETAVSKMYDHCATLDAFGGLADFFKFTYRSDTSTGRKVGGSPVQGVGSKVAILCVNGENQNAVIVGGFRDSNGPHDDKADGHRLHFSFNGVDVAIDKEGALTLGVGGATDATGKTIGDAVGTTITMSTDGEVVVDSKKAIRFGAGGDQPFVLGNKWVSLMEELVDEIVAITVFNAAGTTTQPLNAPKFVAIRARLKTVLSGLVFGKK